jgi:hypothetical protein
LPKVRFEPLSNNKIRLSKIEKYKCKIKILLGGCNLNLFNIIIITHPCIIINTTASQKKNQIKCIKYKYKYKYHLSLSFFFTFLSSSEDISRTSSSSTFTTLVALALEEEG